MRRYRVRLTQEAEADLLDLFEYVAQKDSVASAYHVLDALDALISSLDQHPKRGHHPPELSEHGIKEFCEVLSKPYRVIYQLINKHMVVLGCFDGRRDMQLLLERRLLR